MHGRVRCCALLIGLATLAASAACTGGGERRSETPTSLRHEPTLTYIGADSTIWMVSPSGGDPKPFADAAPCGRFSQLTWSPDGERLACRGAAPDGDPAKLILYDGAGGIVADLTLSSWEIRWSEQGDTLLCMTPSRILVLDRDGNTVADVGPFDFGPAGVAEALPFSLWSPNGGELAYWHAKAGELRIYTISSHSERVVPGDFRPLAWALGGTALLVASQFTPSQTVEAVPSYEVSILDLASGGARRVPQLDGGAHIWGNYRQFWVAPDGRHVALLVPGTTTPSAMAVLDLKTGAFNEIDGSTISYGSDSIPQAAVRFSSDSAYVYWLDLGGGTVIYRATIDGEAEERLSTWPDTSAALSPDLAWFAFTDSELPEWTLNVGHIDGATSRVVATQNFGSGGGYRTAWRPAR